MKGLTWRLRDAAACDFYGCGMNALTMEAADEIDRLRDLVEQLRRTIDAGDLTGLARREGA